MSADVWFKRDIANALLATYQSVQETNAAIGNGDSAKFIAGYRSAISTMALFFGISPGQVIPEQQPATSYPQLPGNGR